VQSPFRPVEQLFVRYHRASHEVKEGEVVVRIYRCPGDGVIQESVAVDLPLLAALAWG
jgi:hypothetical protein